MSAVAPHALLLAAALAAAPGQPATPMEGPSTATAAAGGGAPARAPETPEQRAARLAAVRYPKARWRLGDARTAELTQDGRPDVVLLGVDGTAFLLAVVEGPVTEGSRVLTLRLRSGVAAEDAVCGPPGAVQANVERPDHAGLGGLGAEARERIEAAADAGTVGLVLIHAGETGYCQAFHLLYDGGALAWWRAPARP